MASRYGIAQRNGLKPLLASALLALLWTPASQATTTIVDSFGFESSAGYNNLTPLEGQQGWVTTIGNSGSATIQSSMVHPSGGSQAVQVNRAAFSDDRWAVPVSHLGFPNHRFILIDWDMAVTLTGATSGTGPFFGIETYADALGGFTVLGSLGVDATTGDVLFQDPDSVPVPGQFANTGASVNSNAWHHYQIKLDFELDQYQVLLDGSPLVSADFIDGEFDDFSDADIAALAADLTAQTMTGTAYFDNFLVRDVSPADFDIDGDVDTDDLAMWQGAYGTTGAADADLDGDSDGNDLLIWQREFAGGAPLGASLNQAVPEPSSLALLLFAALGVSLRVRS